jgi:KDO2-lipid IV(A) lauroyltransferase
MPSRQLNAERAQVALLRFGILCIPRLPRALIVMLAHGCGSLLYCFDRRGRRTAMANLALVFGGEVDGLTPLQRRRICRRSFRISALAVLDLLWFSRRTAERVKRWVRLDSSTDHYFKTAPAIVVTGHIGNWEVLGLGTAVMGAPMVAVANELGNSEVTRLLTKLRESSGQRIVPREGAVRHIVKALRGTGRIALLLDQNTPPHEGGMFVPFMGLPATVSKVAGGLWQRTKVPIVVGYCTSDGGGRYTAYALPPFPAAADAAATPESVTTEVVQRLESVIRQHPEQWLWAYKRWKFIPEGASPEDFPFYARPYNGG